MGRLTAISARAIKKVGLHSDGDGLYLKVQASPDPNQPNKSWIFRWGAGGKNTIGLGSTRDVTLADARDAAARQRQLVRQGLDPRAERDRNKSAAAAEVMTFKKATTLFIASKREGWKNAKHAQQWTNTLTTYAHPKIGDLPCQAVTTEHIQDILGPIWTTKHETATRVRGRIECVFDWASVAGHRTGENPARWRGRLEHLLPTISKRRRVQHHAAMPYAQVPALVQRIEPYPSLSAKALLLCIYTATRTGETINAKWDEFDLDAGLWIIPKGRMKRQIEHRVPLSPQAITLLRPIDRRPESEWVFDSQGKGKPLSNMAMLNFLQGTLGYRTLTVHGFRSSFRDWAGETTNHAREVIEQCLAHGLADETEAAYQRGDYLEKRRVLMTDWANFLWRS
jgi:integrase